MKKITLAFVIAITAVCCYAQEGPLTKGQITVNPGIGVGAFLGTRSETAKTPPLSVSVEYALSDGVTIGGIAGYYATRYVSPSRSYDYSFTHKLLGARLNYYYDIGPKLDLYGGAGLGYNAVGFKTSAGDLSDYDASTSGIFYTLHVGTRYNFSPGIGAFAELGYGFTILNLGLSVKLKN